MYRLRPSVSALFAISKCTINITRHLYTTQHPYAGPNTYTALSKWSQLFPTPWKHDSTGPTMHISQSHTLISKPSRDLKLRHDHYYYHYFHGVPPHPPTTPQKTSLIIITTHRRNHPPMTKPILCSTHNAAPLATRGGLLRLWLEAVCLVAANAPPLAAKGGMLRLRLELVARGGLSSRS